MSEVLGSIAVAGMANFMVVAITLGSLGWQGRLRLLVAVGMIDFVGNFGSAILAAPARGLKRGWT